ncbi:NBS-LRR type resistance protein [Cucumis melo var. makuwa]|uniref:NBS-LRR type resistance protein n=1 Tax=Cucumis melo var. makuwa TaxID=1194695 RepID=A0A5A7VKI6_CUCMM|nr:NBS-LRR type resistance protein [Cucumis melo var. makuwa]
MKLLMSDTFSITIMAYLLLFAIVRLGMDSICSITYAAIASSRVIALPFLTARARPTIARPTRLTVHHVLKQDLHPWAVHSKELCVHAILSREIVVMSSGSVERTHQSRDPEGCTYQSSDPEGYTYQSSDPEGCTYQSSDPEGCTYQSSDPEGCTYQSSDPE